MKLSLRDCSVTDYIDYSNALIGPRKIDTLMYFDTGTCTLLRKPERYTGSRVSYRPFDIRIKQALSVAVSKCVRVALNIKTKSMDLYFRILFENIEGYMEHLAPLSTILRS
jgi:hypothetical protein